MVIGGVAALAHGSALPTYDLDVCYRRDAESIRRLCDALRPYRPRLRGAPADLPFVLESAAVLAGLNFTLATEIGELDLLGEVAGLGEFLEVAAQSEGVDLYGRQVKVLSLEGLIRSKEAAGRPKDQVYLAELEALLELQRTTRTG